jgi:hypothetical protein
MIDVDANKHGPTPELVVEMAFSLQKLFLLRGKYRRFLAAAVVDLQSRPYS